MYNTEALSTTGWYKKHDDLWYLVLLKRRILNFPLKTKTWPITNKSPMSRSALARGDKQPKAVLHPHKELWLTLPASLPPSYFYIFQALVEQQKVSFAHVNASHNHVDGSRMPARASVPFQSSARDFKWDSWTQRIWAPQWRHSQQWHGASRDTPNNAQPQWPPAYSGPQAFGCQSRTGVCRREGESHDEVYSQSAAPHRDLFIKP